MAEIPAEDGGIPSLLLTQAAGLTFAVSSIHLTIHWILAGSLIIDYAALLVVAINIGHFALNTCQLSQLHAIWLIKIELHGTGTVTRHEDISAINEDILHSFLLHIVVYFLLDKQIANRRTGVTIIKAEFILMAVHRIYHNMISFTGHLQTWNITLLGNRHLKRTHLLALYVIAPYADI